MLTAFVISRRFQQLVMRAGQKLNSDLTEELENDCANLMLDSQVKLAFDTTKQFVSTDCLCSALLFIKTCGRLEAIRNGKLKQHLDKVLH